ncbi:unnamed protein product [Effrenium voratum]|uniref:Uncharacterized protein n=1 Tax=Effrenium voratum TaxID=2562239 RepID=A0AA36J3L4_9DINO|nr:unnamed protein product [Effrenium voratum]CAJ1398980.1 unnamed protein product [Effrenium voratum]
MRTTLLVYAISAMGGAWSLEQPRSSLVTWHPRMIDLFAHLPQIWQASWWMAHYGSWSPKRHVAWSSSWAIGDLNLGKLSSTLRKKLSGVAQKSAVAYRNKHGVKRFHGTRFLRSTGNYPPRFGLKITRLHERFCKNRVSHPPIPPALLSTPLKPWFMALPWGDLWDDANAYSVLTYLRGSASLLLSDWREAFPSKL